MKHIIHRFSLAGFALIVIAGVSRCRDTEKEKDRTLFWYTAAGTLSFTDGVFDLQQAIPKVLKGVGEDGKGLDFIAWMQKKQIYVNASIYDSLGNAIGIMHRNQWVSNSNLLDRNFDKNAIEVKNNVGEIIFQIEVIGKYIKMRGRFDRRNRHSIIIFSEVNQRGDERTNVASAWPTTYRRQDSITNFMKFTPIFKYPSRDYMGHRSE